MRKYCYAQAPDIIDSLELTELTAIGPLDGYATTRSDAHA
jgi:hypothetical protein